MRPSQSSMKTINLYAFPVCQILTRAAARFAARLIEKGI